MRFISLMIITMVLAFISGLILPWWSVAAASFLIFLLFPQRPAEGFLIAFIGIFLLWFGLALYADIRNDHILSERMSLLIFNHRSSVLIILAGAVIGAIPASFAAMTACLLRTGNKKRLTSFGRFYAKRS
jgi:hypothetical protein